MYRVDARALRSTEGGGLRRRDAGPELVHQSQCQASPVTPTTLLCHRQPSQRRRTTPATTTTTTRTPIQDETSAVAVLLPLLRHDRSMKTQRPTVLASIPPRLVLPARRRRRRRLPSSGSRLRRELLAGVGRRSATAARRVGKRR